MKCLKLIVSQNKVKQSGVKLSKEVKEKRREKLEFG